MSKNNKGFALVPVLITVLVILVVGGGVYYYGTHRVVSPVQDNQTNSTSSSPITITAVTPGSASIGTVITLTGSGFTSLGNDIVLTPQSSSKSRIIGFTPPVGTHPSNGNETSTDGKTLKFRLNPSDFHYENCGTSGSSGCQGSVLLDSGNYFISVIGTICIVPINTPTMQGCESTSTPESNAVAFTVTKSSTGNLSVQFPKLSSNSIYSTNVSYYFVQDWKLAVEDKPFTCVEQSKTVPGQEQVVKKIINGNTYCIYSSGSGAAGTSYADYKYVSERYGKLITISFTLGFPNCVNYLDEPYKSECNNAQSKLNLDSIIDQTFATIK